MALFATVVTSFWKQSWNWYVRFLFAADEVIDLLAILTFSISSSYWWSGSISSVVFFRRRDRRGSWSVAPLRCAIVFFRRRRRRRGGVFLFLFVLQIVSSILEFFQIFQVWVKGNILLTVLHCRNQFLELTDILLLHDSTREKLFYNKGFR